MNELDDAQLLRYSRHLLLEDFGEATQLRLMRSRALIVGLGGLGSPAAIYLAAAGVGELRLADDDRVELHNLQRQIAHDSDAIGSAKTDSAAARLRALNPETRVRTLNARLDGRRLEAAVADADVVIDASDNADTRFALNRACFEHRKPLVSGAAAGAEGRLISFDFRRGRGPCYRCLHLPGDAAPPDCEAVGVLAPATGLIGTAQALEAIKLLGGYGETPGGRLTLLDAKRMRWRELRLHPDPDCPVCAAT